MTHSDKARIPGRLPVIATLGSEPSSSEMGDALNDIALRLNVVSTSETRMQVFHSLVLSILMGQPDPKQALMALMIDMSGAIARAQRKLGEGGTG